ncbi:MAG: RIP metalloprotease RseP [Desulfovibrio sp.]|nr:RIP metalloprotease RseP [Desulfovibrio sp.]
MLITIVSVVLVLGGLIFFHELGHFSVARSLGMGVSTFSLGFGPKLLKWKPGKTEYALSLVPLGGYVALVGESEESEIPEGFTKEESFSLRPAWQRLLVVLAGPVANLLLAWFLYWGLALCWGTPIALPEVGGLQENGPAMRAGVKAGDTILSINGMALKSWDDMSAVIAQSNGEPMDFELQRKDEGGSITTLHALISAERSVRKTLFGEDEVAWLIGVRSSGAVKAQPETFLSAASSGLHQTWKMISLTAQGFMKLIERVVPADQVGGPIMIAQLVGDQAKQGLAGLLALTALISINLGILNLLPIPVLDGGTILFCLLEILFRRPIHQKVQEYAVRAGLALLVALMIFATYNDIVRIVKG